MSSYHFLALKIFMLQAYWGSEVGQNFMNEDKVAQAV